METADDVLAELAEFIHHSKLAVASASTGVRLLAIQIETSERFPGADPDPWISFGDGPPDQSGSRSYGSMWRESEALRQLAEGGPVQARLTQQWVVALYTAWEHEYRPRLAAAHSVEKNAVGFDLWGDLRRLRNDVVHHHGVATAENTGKCRILAHWFHPGDTIALDIDRFGELDALYPWAEMASPPTA